MIASLDVLYEDNHLLVVNKPAGLLTMGDRTGAPTLLEQAKAYLKENYCKPGNVFLGVVHRLDRPVSGVVIFARTSKAAARLSEQFRKRSVEKRYLALVEGEVEVRTGVLTHWLVKDRRANRVTATTAPRVGGQESRLAFRCCKQIGSRTLLEIHPETGRSHQIRVQLAAAGWPIAGDTKYGARSRWRNGIALHASEVRFDHPTRHEPITLSAPLPEGWE